MKISTTTVLKQKGLSVVWVLIAVAVLGTIVFMNLKSINEKKRDAKREADVKQIADALETYWSVYDKYPEENHYFDTSMGCSDDQTLPDGDNWCDRTDLRVLLPDLIAKLPIDPIDRNPYYYYFEPDNGEGFNICQADKRLFLENLR